MKTFKQYMEMDSTTPNLQNILARVEGNILGIQQYVEQVPELQPLQESYQQLLQAWYSLNSSLPFNQ